MTSLARLRQLHHDATPAPWFSVGPPWNHPGPAWINAGSEDPHGGEFVADFAPQPDQAAADHSYENAALVAEVRNALPVLLQIAQAAQDLFAENDFDEQVDAYVALREALSQLGSSTAASSGGEPA